MKRYLAIAEHIEGQVRAGGLQPGDRLLSVRRLSRQRGVSISTVTSAYRLLESRGLIEARPQSGYYVRSQSDRRLAPPAPSRPSRHARVVRVWDVAQQLAEVARGSDLIPMGNADPAADSLPAAALLRRLRQLGSSAERAIAYGDPRGEPELRSQIARRLARAGCQVGADELLITNGAFEGIHLAARAICQPGDVVAVESPVHFILLQLLQGLGLKVIELPTDPELGLDIDEAAALLRAGKAKACLVSPCFHNPLGSLMPPERLKRLVALCSRYRVPLIEDDVYGELYYGDERPPVAKAFDTGGWVIHCSSFSKVLCPGYRIGWIASGRFEDEVLRIKYATNFVTGTPLQLAVSSFLRDAAFERHLRQSRRVYRTNVLRCREAVAAHFPSEGLTASRPRGGFVLWIEVPGLDAMALYERALEAGISIVPGTVFSAQGRFDHCIRLACTRPWDQEQAGAIATLGQITQELLGEG